MSRPGPVLAALCIAIIASAATFPAQAAVTRYAGSPSGEYKLTIDQSEGGVNATLTRLVIPNVTLWQRTLPDTLQPDRAFVSDTGTVTFLSDGHSSESDYALMILHPDATLLSEYTFSDIVTIVQSHDSALDAETVHETWAAGKALLEGDTLVIPVASVMIQLETDTGLLTAVQTGKSDEETRDE